MRYRTSLHVLRRDMHRNTRTRQLSTRQPQRSKSLLERTTSHDMSSKYRTAGLENDSHLPEPPFRTVRMQRGRSVHDDYDFVECLGQGTFGEVHSAVNKETGESVAVKCVHKGRTGGLRKSSLTPEVETTAYHQEFELLRRVNEQQHEQPSPSNEEGWQEDNSHIIRLLGAYDEEPDELWDGMFHMVLQRLDGGELYDYLWQLSEKKTCSESPLMSEALALSFIQQVRSAGIGAALLSVAGQGWADVMRGAQMLQAVEACHFAGFAHLVRGALPLCRWPT